MTTTTSTELDDIMAAEGFDTAPSGGGSWTWSRPTPDGSAIWICTIEQSIDGEPEEREWYVGRHSEGGRVACSDVLTLAEALALAERIPSPLTAEGGVQKTMSRREIEEA